VAPASAQLPYTIAAGTLTVNGSGALDLRANSDYANVHALRAIAAIWRKRQDPNERVSALHSIIDRATGMIEADVVFHRTLVSLADNRRLLTVWESLEGQVRLILSLTRDQVYGDPRDLVEQHAALTAALRSKDGGRAEAQVRSHIEGRIGERQAYWRDTNARQAPMNVAGR